MADRVVLQDAADVVGACSVILYVKESGEGDSFCLILFILRLVISICVLVLSSQRCKSKFGGLRRGGLQWSRGSRMWRSESELPVRKQNKLFSRHPFVPPYLFMAARFSLRCNFF